MMYPLKLKNKFLMKKNTIEKLLKIFILLQPILDCITSLTIRYTNINYSIGFIFRGAFLLFSILYILYNIFINKNIVLGKKRLFIYFICLFLYFIIYFLLHYSNDVSLSQIIVYFVKYFYFPITLISLFILFKSLKIELNNYNKLFFINLMLYIIIILISIFTGTSFYSYGIESRGFSGWFYSANEMSAIITIALPISLLYFNKSEKIYNILYFVFMCLLSIVVVAIGTKTSVLSVIIVQFFLCAISIIKKNKKILFNMIVLLIIVFIELFIGDKIIDHFENFRVTPHQKYVNMSCPVQINFNNSNPVNDEKSDFEKFINKILSDRDSHLKENLLYMGKQPAINYLFGFSFDKSQDNKLSITLIEMDPFDSIFRFGIIGCILIYLPSILIFIQILLKIFKTKTIKLLTCHYLISFVLGIVISTLVGHVISAPAVSIYLTLSLILLYYSVSNCNKEE